MIVLEASAAVDLLLNLGPGVEIRERIEQPDESLHVPHLFDLEVLHVLRRHALHGTLSPERGEEALEDLGNIKVPR